MTLATDQITRAKVLLSPPMERHNALGTLAAALLAATAAVIMAGVIVLGPGFTLEDRSVMGEARPQADQNAV